MNFPLGVIIIVGVLAAISLGFIAASPDEIIEPRIVPVEEKLTVCTMQWDPVCGIDGETYGNLCMLDSSDVKLDYEGECVVAQSELEPAAITSAVPAPPETYTVRIPDGAGLPACIDDNECFVPSSLPVRVGDTVIWNNIDTAAHTVTSGSIEEGLSEIFDSSFFMSGETFVLTFDEAGKYPYFCTLHPWMTGEVVVSKVEEMVVVSEPEPEAVEEESIEEIVMEEEIEEPEVEPEPETLPMTLTVSIPKGVGVLGCEETRECYSPYEVSVAVGTTITWSNDDITLHTVTSGKKMIHDELFDSSVIMSGETFDVTFADAGTFDYYCFVHPWMTGIVHVS